MLKEKPKRNGFLLLLSTVLIPNITIAASCDNDTEYLFDGFWLDATVTGLGSNSHALVGDLLTLKASASWQNLETEGTPINVKLSFDGTLLNSATNNSSTAISISTEKSYIDIVRGTHEALATSSLDSDCNSRVSFVVQSKPTADANGNYSSVISELGSKTTATISLSGDYSVDSDYSFNKSNPTLSWTVNGNVYNSKDVEIELLPGTYTATFKVNDGLYSDSDTATITVIDKLSIDYLDYDLACVRGKGRVFLNWDLNSTSLYYEKEWKPNQGTWQSLGTNTQNAWAVDISGYQNLDSFRVKACSSQRCGQYISESYYTPRCGGFIPN
ncbi:MAG: hypothetical protein JKY81_13215 [Colwellia sp.]|nr:hypothetical protein [Colwellia sp.]